MSEDTLRGHRQPDGAIDRAIDRAVRDIMSVEPPAGLRRRVLSRLEAPPRRVALLPWCTGVVGALAAVVLAVLLLEPSPAPVAPPLVEQAAKAPAPSPVATPTPQSTPEPASVAGAQTARPTTTDANVVLGRFGPDTRLGGEMTLDAEASHRAVRDAIAVPLGLDVVSAAAGILRVTHANIVRGIRVVSIERGHDPRDFALVPFGGAGPMHGTPVARELRIPRLLIPSTPGILCALGQLVSDLRHDFIETRISPHAALHMDAVRGIVERLRRHGNELLAADGVAESKRRIETHVDARYSGQSYELTLPLAEAARWPALPRAFHEMHQARFGHHDAACPVEIVNFGVTAVGVIDAPELPRIAQGREQPAAAARAGRRRVFYETDDPGQAGQWLQAQIYRREQLLAGNVIRGPAVIEEISATNVLYPGDVARVDRFASMLVDVGAAR